MDQQSSLNDPTEQQDTHRCMCEPLTLRGCVCVCVCVSVSVVVSPFLPGLLVEPVWPQWRPRVGSLPVGEAHGAGQGVCVCVCVSESLSENVCVYRTTNHGDPYAAQQHECHTRRSAERKTQPTHFFSAGMLGRQLHATYLTPGSDAADQGALCLLGLNMSASPQGKRWNLFYGSEFFLLVT